VHDPLLAQLGRYLARAFEMGASGDSLYVDALAHALGAHLVEQYSDRGTVRQERPPDALCWRQLEQVYDYIECNLHRPLTVTELAAVAGVSPTHFTRLFRRQTGEPPYRYVRKRRLDRAERLIVGTQLSLAAVAAAVGFSDQSHLSRVMRAERGLTPGQVRDLVM
jgi:AraC family transcriptional regulator